MNVVLWEISVDDRGTELLIRRQEVIEVVDVANVRFGSNLLSIININRDTAVILEWVVWCLRRDDNSCTFRFDGVDGVLHIPFRLSARACAQAFEKAYLK